ESWCSPATPTSSWRACARPRCGSTTASSARPAASKTSCAPTRVRTRPGTCVRCSPRRQATNPWPSRHPVMSESVFAVVVTHRRPDELAKSLDVLSTQTRLPDHLIVVDNDGSEDNRVRDLVAAQPISTTYLGSRRNLGGAGGFALGILHALAQGADWVWLADDDGRPQDTGVLATLLACAEKYGLAEVSPMVCNLDDPERLAFPLRRGLVWRRRASELRTEEGQDLLRGIASLFNGALFRASTLDAVGVPDMRLFIRGDEVELHRRLVRSGLPFGTCMDAVYLHPCGSEEFKPIL